MIRRIRNRYIPSPIPETIQSMILGELRLMTINNQGVDPPIFIK
jgi:hypothetical protein